MKSDSTVFKTDGYIENAIKRYRKDVFAGISHYVMFDVYKTFSLLSIADYYVYDTTGRAPAEMFLF